MDRSNETKWFTVPYESGNGQVVDRKAMKFTASRLNSLMRLLEISKLEEFSALLDVATFATLLATYTEEVSGCI